MKSSTQANDALFKLNEDRSELCVHLASSSEVKKEASYAVLQSLFAPLTINLTTHDAKSDVNSQPVDKETIQGANNRLKWVEAQLTAEDQPVLISIENGIRYDNETNKHFDFVHVIVKKGEHRYEETQDCCEIPKPIIDEMRKTPDGTLLETWGETAQRLNMAKAANNPHQEDCFGGISRCQHISNALIKAAGQLKADLCDAHTAPLDGQFQPLNRFYPLKAQEKTFGMAALAPVAHDTLQTKPIDFYNHGCPTKAWGIPADIVNHHQLKIFETGDAFAIIHPDVKITNAVINIHVGLEHKTYCSDVLLQESLQLCRCAYEHGARFITVALPQELHPVLHDTVDNRLLSDMFQASGAHQLYFYDRSYRGQLEVSLPKPSSKPHIILSCSANKSLAEKIAEKLHLSGEPVQLYSIEGKGKDARIPDEVMLKGAVVTLVQSTRPNPDDIDESARFIEQGASTYLFETLNIANQARLRGAIEVKLINPYQFGARSDKAEDNSKGKTGAYVQQNGLLLKAAGVHHVITAECHDVHTLSGAYTSEHNHGSVVPALSLIATQLAQEWLADSDYPLLGQLRLVTPDAGAAKRTKALTQELQDILGQKLCKQRILGEKERDTHQDNSARISSMNAGEIAVNPQDKYLITDDETATGSTLCQAINSLTAKGAKDISVIVVHNNMPLNWLERQLCLARFLYLGVHDLHFSDTHEMGTLAKSYEDLLTSCQQKCGLNKLDAQAKIEAWFKKNVATESLSSELDAWEKFKSTFSQFETKIRIHSLADAFANKIRTQPALSNLDDDLTTGERVISPKPTAVPGYAQGVSTLFFGNKARQEDSAATLSSSLQNIA